MFIMNKLSLLKTTIMRLSKTRFDSKVKAMFSLLKSHLTVLTVLQESINLGVFQ